MVVNSADEMFGFQIIKLREFFRKYSMHEWDAENMICFFDIDKTKANKLMKAFKEKGFIEKWGKFRNVQLWRTSIKGNGLALASAAKPILRATASRKIEEFLARVKVVNKNEYYLYKVEKVLVFGSYLGTNERLGDVDIAIKISSKELNSTKFAELAKIRSSEAENNGRHFSNSLQKLFWPQEEVLRYLKSRSRSISIHFTDDPVLKNAEYKVIFEEN